MKDIWQFNVSSRGEKSLPLLFSCVIVLLAAGLFCEPVCADEVGGFLGVPQPYGTMMEEDCRACHEDYAIVKPVYLPDRHHLLDSMTVPDHTDAPFASPGESYECLSCHEQRWDPLTVQNEFIVGRDCTVCHQVDSDEPVPPAAETGNLALYQPARASSSESGYAPGRAVDGNDGTSWWQDSSRDHWLTVDLQQSLAISKVVVRWGHEYASDYLVEVSTNAYSWTRVADIRNGNGGTNVHEFSSRNARYVRIYCTEDNRNGYQIVELEVFDSSSATPASTDQKNTVHHRSTPAQSGDCTYCHKVPVSAQDRPKQAACRECHGRYQHDNGGPIQDYAACASCHDTMPYHAKPPRAVGYTRIVGGKGRFNIFWAEFTDNGQDQEDTFLEDIEPNGDDMDDEGGFRWSRPTIDFNYKRIFKETSSGGNYFNVPHFDEFSTPLTSSPLAAGISGNLALNKSVQASRSSSYYAARNAVDGSSNSRWVANDDKDEWLRIDLGAAYKISKVDINWYREYAQDYRIRVSTDGSSWTTVKTVSSGNGGTDSLTFSARDARYVLIECIDADRDYFSIYEVEVYQ